MRTILIRWRFGLNVRRVNGQPWRRPDGREVARQRTATVAFAASPLKRSLIRLNRVMSPR